jgi:hypothetical protein
MIRLGVLLLHIALASQTALGGALFLVQGRLNRTWEMGFYGAPSPLTDGMVVASVFMVMFATMHTLTAVAWAFGSRQGGFGLLLITALLIAVYPAFVAILLTFTGMLVMLDLLVSGMQDAGEAPPG